MHELAETYVLACPDGLLERVEAECGAQRAGRLLANDDAVVDVDDLAGTRGTLALLHPRKIRTSTNPGAMHFYNRRRRYSSIDYLTPSAYERKWLAERSLSSRTMSEKPGQPQTNQILARQFWLNPKRAGAPRR